MGEVQEQQPREALKTQLLQNPAIRLFCGAVLEHHGEKPHKSGVREREMYINDVVSIAREDQSTLGISLRPAPIADFHQLLQSVRDGFIELARFLKDKNCGLNFSKIDKIRMVSWLLGPGFSDKIKDFLGDYEERLKQLPDDCLEVAESQKLALFYNQPSLKRYLLFFNPPDRPHTTLSFEKERENKITSQ